MGLLKKWADYLAPEVDEDIYLDEEEEVVTERQEEVRKVVGGSSVDTGRSTAAAPVKRPNLTLHTDNTGKVPEFKIKIFVPQRFDDVREIADMLKAKSAVVVNYERVELPEQQRICDFLNGVCYVQDGFLHRISNTMVVYAPSSVEIDEIKSVGATL
ncbi:MAG: cell division protein SepF [Anaerovibrio sp.]|uniref:cell division protein SepF n=1 Tax=uncultured Anaerovibrio sp. TaxID=361586 RepID=UPI001B4D4645|nr:cell division protein SepF [uncultured Anaerovibrio sp.]MBP3232571.1 cell division protein SepF [Anaerovibrio sp.]